mgnify:CR=1 FL=1
MNAVLISIKPEYCQLIAAGEKKIEVRKSRPKLETPFKCYIYCTKGKPILGRGVWKNANGEVKDLTVCEDYDFDIYNKDSLFKANGKVIGEFVCDYISEFFPERYPFNEDGTCLTPLQIMDYANGKKAYGWHISDLVIYDKPKELCEFFTVDKATVKKCIFRHRDIINPDYTNGGILKGGYSCFSKTMETNFCRPYENEYCECLKVLTRPPQSWCYCEEVNDDR